MSLENGMFYHKNDPKIILPQISPKCIIPNINDLESYGQGHKASMS